MFTTRPELAGTFGMVASTHWLASASGMAVLEDGGNAFDAAVAAGFVLQLAEPHLCGPAGQVPGIFVTAGDPTPRVLAAQGVSPAAATPEHFADLGLDLIPGSGLLPATVPGAWDGWLLLLRDYGTKSLREVLRYAISYARNGIPLVSRVGDTISAVERLFVEHWPTSAELWLPGGKPAVAPGRRVSSPRRSTRSAARLSATTPAATTAACSPPTTSPPGRRPTKTRSRPTSATGPWSRWAAGRRARRCCSRRCCCTASNCPMWTESRPSGRCIWPSKPRSSPSPIAKTSMPPP